MVDRTLIHVTVAHDLPEILAREEGNVKSVDIYHKALRRCYKELTARVLRVHRNNPFQKVYTEGYDAEQGNVISRKIIMHMPIRALVSQGVELMVTEHPAARLIKDVLMHITRSARETHVILYSGLKGQTLDTAWEIFGGGYFGDRPELFWGFFDGCSSFDFMAARENWIGRNIEKTLGDGERGILFLGVNHGTVNIARELNGVNYEVYSPFGDLHTD